MKDIIFKKICAITFIVLLVNLTFSVAISLAPVDEKTKEKLDILPGVSAQSSGCCVKSNAGEYCAVLNSSQCDTSSGFFEGSSCSAVGIDGCLIGTCLEETGTCSTYKTKKQCTDGRGFFTTNALAEVAECQPGCCIYKRDDNSIAFAEWKNFRKRCEISAENYGMKVEVTTDTPKDCALMIPADTLGYCWRATSCSYGKKSDCPTEAVFSQDACPNCPTFDRLKCSNGDVYKANECGGLGTISKACTTGVSICVQRNSTFAECSEIQCRINLTATTLQYGTAWLKTNEVGVWDKSGERKLQAGDYVTLAIGESACVQYQGPGESHYIYVCNNDGTTGKVESQSLTSSRSKVCYYDDVQSAAVTKDNSYQSCGQCKTGVEIPPGAFRDIWVAFFGETFTPEWLNYWELNPGMCDAASDCTKLGDCMHINNNDCVPKYTPGIGSESEGAMCLECENTKASSPWAKCADSTQCASRGYCAHTSVEWHPEGAMATCLAETIVNLAAKELFKGVVKVVGLGIPKPGKELEDNKKNIIVEGAGFLFTLGGLLKQPFATWKENAQDYFVDFFGWDQKALEDARTEAKARKGDADSAKIVAEADYAKLQEALKGKTIDYVKAVGSTPGLVKITNADGTEVYFNPADNKFYKTVVTETPVAGAAAPITTIKLSQIEDKDIPTDLNSQKSNLAAYGTHSKRLELAVKTAAQKQKEADQPIVIDMSNIQKSNDEIIISVLDAQTAEAADNTIILSREDGSTITCDAKTGNVITAVDKTGKAIKIELTAGEKTSIASYSNANKNANAAALQSQGVSAAEAESAKNKQQITVDELRNKVQAALKKSVSYDTTKETITIEDAVNPIKYDAKTGKFYSKGLETKIEDLKLPKTDVEKMRELGQQIITLKTASDASAVDTSKAKIVETPQTPKMEASAQSGLSAAGSINYESIRTEASQSSSVAGEQKTVSSSQLTPEQKTALTTLLQQKIAESQQTYQKTGSSTDKKILDSRQSALTTIQSGGSSSLSVILDSSGNPIGYKSVTSVTMGYAVPSTSAGTSAAGSINYQASPSTGTASGTSAPGTINYQASSSTGTAAGAQPATTSSASTKTLKDLGIKSREQKEGGLNLGLFTVGATKTGEKEYYVESQDGKYTWVPESAINVESTITPKLAVGESVQVGNQFYKKISTRSSDNEWGDKVITVQAQAPTVATDLKISEIVPGERVVYTNVGGYKEVIVWTDSSGKMYSWSPDKGTSIDNIKADELKTLGIDVEHAKTLVNAPAVKTFSSETANYQAPPSTGTAQTTNAVQTSGVSESAQNLANQILAPSTRIETTGAGGVSLGVTSDANKINSYSDLKVVVDAYKQKTGDSGITIQNVKSSIEDDLKDNKNFLSIYPAGSARDRVLTEIQNQEKILSYISTAQPAPLPTKWYEFWAWGLFTGKTIAVGDAMSKANSYGVNVYESYYGSSFYYPISSARSSSESDAGKAWDAYFKSQGDLGKMLLDRVKSMAVTAFWRTAFTTIVGKVAAKKFLEHTAKIYGIPMYINPSYWMQLGVCYATAWAYPGGYTPAGIGACLNNPVATPLFSCILQSYSMSKLGLYTCTPVSASALSPYEGYEHCSDCNPSYDPNRLCTKERCEALSKQGASGCVYDLSTQLCMPNMTSVQSCASNSGTKIDVTDITNSTKITAGWKMTGVNFSALSYDVEIKTNKFAECRYSLTKSSSFDNMTSITEKGKRDENGKVHKISLGVRSLDADDLNFTYYVQCADVCAMASRTALKEIQIVKKSKADSEGPLFDRSKQQPYPGEYIVGSSTGKVNVLMKLVTDEPATCYYGRYRIAEGYEGFAEGIMEFNSTAQRMIDAGKTEEEISLAMQQLAKTPTKLNKDATGKEHSDNLQNLNNSHQYAYLVRCNDSQNNPSLDYIVKFSVSEYYKAEVVKPTGTIDDYQPDLEAKTDRNAMCRYSFNKGTKYDDMTEFMETGGTEHKSSLTNELIYGSHTLYVKCKDDKGNVAAAEGGFSIIKDIASPAVVRAYKDVGDISDSLIIITNEQSKCEYAFKSFSFGQGSATTGNDPMNRVHMLDWRTDVTYYIICVDRTGNKMPLFTAKPYEISTI